MSTILLLPETGSGLATVALQGIADLRSKVLSWAEQEVVSDEVS